MKKLVAIAFLAVLFAACGPTTETEGILLAWGPILNAHLATGGMEGDDYAFPTRLDQVDPALTAALSQQDAWGQKLLYRRIQDDKYQLISAGRTATTATMTTSLVEKRHDLRSGRDLQETTAQEEDLSETAAAVLRWIQ